MRKIRSCVIGLGRNGTTAVRAVLKAPNTKEVIGCDLNPEMCKKCEDELGIRTTTNFEEVLADPEIELIFISTSNSSHYPLGKAALEAGKKVCMEKPMGITLEETESLLKVVEQTDGWLTVGFELRNYSTLFSRIKDLLDGGEIGKLRHINCQYILSPFGNTTDDERWKHDPKLSGGLFQEKLCHYIDLPRWWTGSRINSFFITKAENVIPYYGISDNFELTYKFEDGTVSHLTFIMGAAGGGKGDLIDTYELSTQAEQGYRLYYQLVGSEGAIEANVFRRRLQVFHHPGKPGFGDKSQLMFEETWEQPDDNTQFHNTTDEKIDTVQRVAQDLPPIIDPHDAAETMRLCYEFEAAAVKEWKVYNR